MGTISADGDELVDDRVVHDGHGVDRVLVPLPCAHGKEVEEEEEGRKQQVSSTRHAAALHGERFGAHVPKEDLTAVATS